MVRVSSATRSRVQHHEPKLRRNAENQAAAEKQKQMYEVFTNAVEPTSTMMRNQRQQGPSPGTLESMRAAFAEMKTFQILAAFLAVFMIAWSGLVTFVLFDISLRYLFGFVEDQREQYIVEASMGLLQFQAARALLAALHARDAVCVAVQNGIMRGASPAAPLDVERVLAPALLASSLLHSVELSLSDSEDVWLVSQSTTEDGSFKLMMQSSSPDCYLLGSKGCIDPPGRPGERPEWFTRYASLPNGTVLGYGSTGRAVEPGSGLLVQSAWDEGPGSAEEAGAPFYGLGFRCGGDLEVAGRVTLRLKALSGTGWLGDSHLGLGAEVYLADRFGTVLAAEPATELRASGTFVKAWELARPWARALSGAFANGEVQDMQIRHGADSHQVVLRQLKSPFEHFAIAVVVPDYWSFVHLPMYVTSVASIAISAVPWLLCLIFFGTLFVQSWNLNRQLKALDPTKEIRGGDSSFSLGSKDVTGSWALLGMLTRTFRA